MKDKIYEFTVYLDGFTPRISRRFQINWNYSVQEFIDTLMILYEMDNSHLSTLYFEHYTFNSDITKTLLNYYDELMEPDHKEYDVDLTLNELNLYVGCKMKYYYDFINDWILKIKLEKILYVSDVKSPDIPYVIRERGFGIIENCGGLYVLSDVYYNDKSLLEFDVKEKN